MSADNAVVIIKTKRTAKYHGNGYWEMQKPNYVYRLAEMQAVDQLDWVEQNQLYNFGALLKDVFGSSEVYEMLDEAMDKANIMLKNDYYEYGACFRDYSSYIFFGDI